MQQLTPTVKQLLIANVFVFLVVMVLGVNSEFARSTILYPPSTDDFQLWQLITYAFRHNDVSHILFNMMGLFFLGPMVEYRLGGKRLLILYFAAILGAVLFHLGIPDIGAWQLQQAYEAFAADPSLANFDAFFMDIDLRSSNYSELDAANRPIKTLNGAAVAGDLQNALAYGGDTSAEIAEAERLMLAVIDSERGSPMLGASGGVAGVVAAFAVLYPNEKLSLLFIPIGFAAKYFVLVIFGIDLLLGVLNISGDNIAHFAHIGGAVTGALLAWYFAKTTTPPWMRRLD